MRDHGRPNPAIMDSNGPYLVKIAGAVRGPVGIAQLREMGTIDVVTPETEIAPRPEGPWVRLATLAICVDVFPPRRAIEFKAAQFEELNRGPAPGMNPAEAIEQANRPPPTMRGREVRVTPQGLRATRSDQPRNEMQEMVLDVGRRVAANAPVVVLPPPPPRFRRWPWFAALSLFGSAGILAIPLLYDGNYDAMSTSILAGWVVLFNGLLAMLLVLDRRLDAETRLNRAKMDILP